MSDGILCFSVSYGDKIVVFIGDNDLLRIMNLKVVLYGNQSKISEEDTDVLFGELIPFYKVLPFSYFSYVAFEIDEKVINCKGDLSYKIIRDGLEIKSQRIDLAL
jgi:hypothetical protein